MDLTRAYPRSPKDEMLGLVSLKRTIDKARAYNDGMLGEYDYDCPHDRALFEFLGVDGKTFAAKVQDLGSDERIAAWIERELLPTKTRSDIERFDEERMQWHPEPGTQAEEHFDDLREEIAPDRGDVKTWFDLLDLDEGRPVPNPTRIKQPTR
jgi:hypothetical protein